LTSWHGRISADQAVTRVTPARWRGVRLRRLALLLLSTVLLGVLAVPDASAGGGLSGVDVSNYQHDNGRAIDWAAVRRSGRTFAFLKATEGTGYTDPWFTREWAAAAGAGMVRGAYHYADPSQSADAQAAHVVAVVGSTREQRDLGIVLDLESTGGLSQGRLVAWAHAFLDGVERRTGRVPILYSYPYFWQTAMGGDGSFGAYPLWLASYSRSTPAPLPGWPRWTFWQSSSSGQVPGVPGTVDLDAMCCSVGTLAALADGRTGPITALWKHLGGASGPLGLPLGPETAVPGGWGQTFEKGFVASTRTYGTHAVLGAVYARYRAAGGARGALGVPVRDQEAVLSGVVQQGFAGGWVVSSQATGAHAVVGSFATRWARDHGVRSQEGLPTAERTGAGQQFVAGGLYATTGGVRLVPGAIRDRYEELGGPSSPLGLPASEARTVLNGRIVDFQLGSLAELEIGGRRVVV
jgi:lysozyme